MEKSLKKRFHRFYIEQGGLDSALEEGGAYLLRSKTIKNQLLNVFRFREGDQIVLFDGSGFDFIGEIIEEKSHVSPKDEIISIQLKEKMKNSLISKRKLVLYQSIIKKDHFEWIAEKATELGVSKIIPVLSERSEKKELNEERIKKILTEATEQCGRDLPLKLGAPMKLKDALAECNIPKIVFDLNRDKVEEKNIAEEAAIFIGPEGGWGKLDLALFEKTNELTFASFGDMTLRAETAAIAACTLFLV
jgi:16S rRNA (uracil1498-N3)-methyltransferase